MLRREGILLCRGADAVGVGVSVPRGVEGCAELEDCELAV